MKKSLIAFLTFTCALWTSGLAAQSHKVNLKNKLEPYGSFRTYAIFDTRDVIAGTGDMFYYIPLDYSRNLEGQDIHSNPSMKAYALTTMLGVNVSGLQYGKMKVGGNIEADFYLRNGTAATMRLRKAYADISWDGLGYAENRIAIRAGQDWHPMAADMPYCVNVECGSPFSPHTRSPQLMFDFSTRHGFHVTAGALYPMQFLPTGPVGPSENYVKYGLIPELYGGISYEGKSLIARAGADFISLRPRWRTTEYLFTEDTWHDVGTKVRDRISMISPFAYLEFRHGLFRINAKSVFASGGDHLQLLGGYALYDWRDPLDYKYTPLRSSVSFASFSVGNKFQFLCMGGYYKALGTKHNLPVDEQGYSSASYIYFFSGGMVNIDQMVRVTPTLAFNLGGLTIAVEYDNTCVWYGSVSKLDNYARPLEDVHTIINHRVLGVMRYSF